MNTLLSAIQSYLDHHHLASPGDLLVVAVSGGPDSVCLLHVLRHVWNASLRLHVAHLNHGLRGTAAEADAAFVTELAAQWSLPATIGHRDVPALVAEQHLSVEEAARLSRYAFLAGVARQMEAQAVAVGHNADDQAETILLHLLRGSGLDGLIGMRPQAICPEEPQPGSNPVPLIRPLLTIGRADIEAYCQVHQLPTRLDSTNLDTHLTRNRVRHELLPLLATYNPRIREALRHTGEVVAGEAQVLEEIRDQAWVQVCLRSSATGVVFDRAVWRLLPLALRRACLRRAIQTVRGRLHNASFELLEQAVALAQHGQPGDQADLPAGLRLRVGAAELTIALRGEPGPAPDWPLVFTDQSVSLLVPGSTALPDSDWRVETRILPAGTWTLAEVTTNPDPWQAFLDRAAVLGDGASLLLRRAQPDERFQPLGLSGHSLRVRTFWINEKIPQPWRRYLPVVSQPDHLVWLAGWRIDERARVQVNTEDVLWLRFTRLSG